MKNASQKVETDEIQVARAICNLHLCYNFALVTVLRSFYVKDALVFSQSDARDRECSNSLEKCPLNCMKYITMLL